MLDPTLKKKHLVGANRWDLSTRAIKKNRANGEED